VCLIRGFLISDEESSYEEALEAAQIRGRSQPTMPGSTQSFVRTWHSLNSTQL
jgi:hypothetical protein